MKIYLQKITAVTLSIVSLIATIIGMPATSYAASLTSLSDTLSSSKISTLANHEVKFVTTTAVNSAGVTYTVTFASGFTMGTFAIVNADFAVGNTNNCTTATYTDKTLAASAAASTWGIAQSGQVITLTSPTNATTGEISAARCVRLRLGSNAVVGGTGSTQITNPSSAGNVAINIAGTVGDTGTITVPILSNDQVAVTATVPQSLTFTISQNSIAFGTLDPANARYANTTTGSASEVEAHQIVAGTNATTGYTVTVQGATLTSGSNTIAAIGSSNTASAAGTAQFGLRMTATGGSGTAATTYAGSGFGYGATASAADVVASAGAATANTTYSVRYLTNISTLTPAGDYSTALTYAATANF